jgi:hypothetical protein
MKSREESIMEHLTEPTLWAFLLQAVAFVAYIPLSYLAYRWVRAPLKRDRVKQSLSQLGIVQTEELEETMAGEYRLRHYLWPLSLACLTTMGLYALTHPYLIQGGLWVGILEEVINVHGGDNTFPRAIIGGRALFWGWLGAYIYSFHLTSPLSSLRPDPKRVHFYVESLLAGNNDWCHRGRRCRHFLYSGRRAL